MKNKKLSKNEMRKVFGGEAPKSCSASTTCKNGQTISITGCVGICEVIPWESVSCAPSNPNTPASFESCLGGDFYFNPPML